MDQVILLCGSAGSGKSTHARTLGAEGYTLPSFDAEAWRRGLRRHPVAEGPRREIHRALQRRLLDLVADGTPVVVDTSFWSRSSRDEYRELLAQVGVSPVVHYLRTPRQVVLERLAARQDSGPDDIPVPVERAIAYLDGFQEPSSAEGPLRVIDPA
jgi:predicted kinase